MYLATLKEDMPFVTIEDGGETIRMGELSPGCMLCKEGRWDCLFLTPLCNLSCTFCISPLHSRKQVKLSVFGRTLQEIASNHKKTNICGIGYSGGEALMAKDEL
ncbi:MAG: hypothetical protein PHO32_03415, partial [Candidatus Cloacimonetes bacterium]|nr:hypothetical protein [Candidatus Cloacimonadota bacterium]